LPFCCASPRIFSPGRSFNRWLEHSALLFGYGTHRYSCEERMGPVHLLVGSDSVFKDPSGSLRPVGSEGIGTVVRGEVGVKAFFTPPCLFWPCLFWPCLFWPCLFWQPVVLASLERRWGYRSAAPRRRLLNSEEVSKGCAM